MQIITSDTRAASLALNDQFPFRQVGIAGRAGLNAGLYVGRHSLAAGAVIIPIRGSHLRGGLRLFAFLLIMLVATPFLFVGLYIRNEDRRAALVRFFYGILRRAIGLRLVVTGTPTEAMPAIYVSNHLSYLDIPVLGSLLKASFISRGDVAGWPVIGFLSKLQRTIFTSRSRNTAVAEAKTIRARLEAGDRLLMFPEGSSADGNHLLPFKSTFFAVAAPIIKNGIEQQIVVQPISLTLTELGDLPIGRHQRPFYAWFGDMDFAPHFWQALQLPGFTIEVRFHAPTTLAQAGDRKALCAYCEREIMAGVDEGLSGRPKRL